MQITGAAMAGQKRVETGGQKAASSPETTTTLSFSEKAVTTYPPQARGLVLHNLALLQRLPLPLLPLLLREIEAYDWRFPRERAHIDAQLTQLQAMSPAQRETVLAPFRNLRLPEALAAMNWVADPSGYLDALTAALWSSGQMPAFRQAAKDYAAALPAPASAMATPTRQAFVVLDGSLAGTAHFAQLRPHGVSLRIADKDALETLMHYVQQRAAAAPGPYQHWYIDGAAAQASDPAITSVSYDALSPVRSRLLERARSAMSAERSGPEELRSLMAHTTPEQIGMDHEDATLAHFQLSLLTEGSGTQIFATTFVQWAARECLRRAEPSTLFLRFTPRQREQGMNEMLAGAPSQGPDAAGSLVDAEQGAWYTWINLRRLPAAQPASFLAWHAGSGAAVAIGAGLPRGTSSAQPQTMQQVIRLLG